MPGSAIGSVLAVLVVLHLGAPQQSPPGRHSHEGSGAHILPVASEASGDVRLQVQRLRRAPQANVITIAGSTKGRPTKSVAFRFEVSRAEPGKTYQLWFQDMGMKAEALPPVPVPDQSYRFKVDSAGQWTPKIPSFHAVDFAKGEWIQFWIRSTDGSVSRGVRFVPVS